MLRHSLELYRGFRSTAAVLQAAEAIKRKLQRICLSTTARPLYSFNCSIFTSGTGPNVDHGTKAILYSILSETSIPLNSAQIWEQAEVSLAAALSAIQQCSC